MRTLVKHAVFIEPEGPLRESILSDKKRINLALPEQPYCHHPPHSTVFISVLEKCEVWLERLKSVVQKVPPFHATVRDTVVFYDDELTNGGHTIALRMELSPQLLSLQKTIAAALVPFVDRKTVGLPSDFLEEEPFRMSYCKYGSPFIGEHWVPHFTIASLKVSRDDPLITNFQNNRPEYDFVVNRVSAWRVEADIHTQLATFELGKP